MAPRRRRAGLPVALLVPLAAAAAPPPDSGEAEMGSRLRAHVVALADDALAGRGGGTPGEERSCAYIAGEFAAAGLRPAAPTEGGPGFVRRFALVPAQPPTPFERTTSCNVEGLLPGRDAETSEVIVVGAHHDGQGREGEADPGRFAHTADDADDPIWNSADDNATSVAAVIEVARSLAGGPPPRRTIVFATFGAEEHAYNGSVAYLAAPPLPWARHVAMLNLEKLGRAPDQQLLAAAGSSAAQWSAILAQADARTGWQVPIALPEIVADSDHYPFAAARLPAIVLGTAHEEDTHRPSDSAERIRFDLLEQRTRYVLEFVRALAESEAPLVFAGELGETPGFFAVAASAAERAAAGLAEPAVALKVSSLMPAAPPGLEAGDVIVSLDGQPLAAALGLGRPDYEYPRLLHDRLVAAGPSRLGLWRGGSEATLELPPT